MRKRVTMPLHDEAICPRDAMQRAIGLRAKNESVIEQAGTLQDRSSAAAPAQDGNGILPAKADVIGQPRQKNIRDAASLEGCAVFVAGGGITYFFGFVQFLGLMFVEKRMTWASLSNRTTGR